MVSALGFLLLGQYPGASPFPNEWKSALNQINSTEARGIATYLAGPEFNGRETGSVGHAKAARWAANWMQKNGILPGASDGTYFQPFVLDRSVLDIAKTRLTFPGGDLRIGVDVSLVANLETKVTRPIAFVRLAADDEGSKLDKRFLRDRIVIVRSDGTPAQRASFVSALSQQPPAERPFAVFSVVTTPLNRPANPSVRVRGLLAPGTSVVSGAQISPAAADRIAQAASVLSFVGNAKPETGLTVSFADATLDLKLKALDSTPTLNVVGRIDGSDPKLKSEAVVIGAHLDHLGVSNGRTYWGADDNASGSTAALLAGRALASGRGRLKRTVLIGLWSAEERGLLGSRAFVGSPTIPTKDIVAYLNMDMVGRDANHAPLRDRASDNWNAITLGSAKITSSDLFDRMAAANRSIGLVLRTDKEDRTMRSDTGSFAAVGIPVAKLWSGEHEDYHKPTDTPEKLNGTKIANVARWVTLCAADLSVGTRPTFVRDGRLLRGRIEGPKLPELTPDTTLTVELLEDGKVLDRTVQPRPGTFPLLFGLAYVLAKTVAERRYSVQLSLSRPGGRRLYKRVEPLLRNPDGSLAVVTVRLSPTDQVP